MSTRDKWTICFVCRGDGHHVNPNIDANGISPEEFADDPDFAESYFGGDFDIGCSTCDGSGKLLTADLDDIADALSESADARRLAAREDGDYEAYSMAGDYRYG